CNGSGACVPCVTSAQCTGSQSCVANMCVTTCSDATKDGQETDTDCGGPACGPCAVGKSCQTGGGCQTGRGSATGGRLDGLLISQLQTRGVNGGNDEFVEIYNPGTISVTFDSTWKVSARSATGGLANCATAGLGDRFSGMGQVIPPHGHVLYA